MKSFVCFLLGVTVSGAIGIVAFVMKSDELARVVSELQNTKLTALLEDIDDVQEATKETVNPDKEHVGLDEPQRNADNLKKQVEKEQRTRQGKRRVSDDPRFERQRQLARKALFDAIGNASWDEIYWTQTTAFDEIENEKQGWFAKIRAQAAATTKKGQDGGPTTKADVEAEMDLSPTEDNGSMSPVFYLSAVRFVSGFEDRFSVRFIEENGSVSVDGISR